MLSKKLKEATTTAHQQLNGVVVRELKAIGSKEDYADFLKKFYAYFHSVEQAIHPYIHTEVLPDYEERRNAAYLKRDIEVLGQTIDELPIARAPEINSLQEAWGALYVLEGSVTGGRIVVKMLENQGITEGVSFFSGYGEATAQKWDAFTSALNTGEKTPEEEDLSIKAANDTFTRFGWMFSNEIARVNE